MANENPSYRDLIDYASGDIEGTVASAIRDAIQRSPDQRAVVQRFQSISTIVAEDDTVPAPAATVARAKSIFDRQKRSVLADALETLDRMIAALVFDSRATPAVAGLRGATSERTRLSFECELGEIDLEVAEREDGVRAVTGQLDAGSAAKVMQIALTDPQTNDVVVEVETDPGGVFSFVAPPGTYDLFILSGDQLVVVPQLELQ